MQAQRDNARRVRLGAIDIDVLTFAEALDAIAALVEAGRGGSVYTPNIDHVVNAESNAEFRAAYRAASLSLVDGKPVVWASRLLGQPLPEKISGSDLIGPLMSLAGKRKWRVYILGGAAGAGEQAARRVQEENGVNIVGVDAPLVSLSANPEHDRAIVEKIRAAAPQLLLVALGSPKQELFIHRVTPELGPVVAVAVGAAVDFVAGRVKRAPRWMSEVGLEWLYRLAQEPKRLWRRYLVNDPQFVWILGRMLLSPTRGKRPE